MNFVVVGAGAWGTAFAVHLSRLGHTVSLVPRRIEQALALASGRENTDYLPSVKLPPSLQIGHELPPVLMEADIVLLACPSQALRESCERLNAASGAARNLKLVLSLAKGLELKTHLRPSEVMRAVLPKHIAVGSLSGPTNAAEVANGLPAAMVMAVDDDKQDWQNAQTALSGATLRVYTSGDTAGVELGGAMKNIYAIAAGACDGMRLGDNARAALLTRSLAEMVRVGTVLGAKPETFYGLSGLGDLAATCYGSWSRNHEFGKRVGEGASPEELLRAQKTVVEGYRTCESFAGLCREKKLDAPIILEAYEMLFNKKPVPAVVETLMLRDLKREGPK